MRKKTKRWILGIVGGIVLLLAWIVLLSPWVWPAPGMDSLVVGRETTWLENPPMNPDGTVNYGKAINDIMTAGVTPENNAMVCFIHAIGLDGIVWDIDDEPTSDGDAFQKFMGQPASAITGPFLTPNLHGLIQDIIRETSSDVSGDGIGEHLIISPWSDKKYPLVREWVDRNAKPLGWMVEGSKRARCSHGQRCEGEDSVIVANMNGRLYELDSATCGLLIRAMGSLSHGKLQRAWDDTMAVRRIARLFCQGTISILENRGIDLENYAIKAQQTILASDALRLDQVTAWLNELQALPPLPDASLMREMNVLSALSMADNGPDPHKGILFLGEMFPLSQWPDWVEYAPPIDVLLVMQKLVKCVRESERIANLPTLLERKRAMQAAIVDWYANPFSMGRVATLLLGTPAARRRATIDIFWVALPQDNPAGPMDWECPRSVSQTGSELTRVMAAMAVYRAKHKQWPATLEDLVPAILPRVPADPWSDSQAPLKYKRTPDGFLLYSIGYNETDDGGVDPGSSAGIYDMLEGDVSICVPSTQQADE